LKNQPVTALLAIAAASAPAGPAVGAREGAFAVGGLRCAVSEWSVSGTREFEMLLPRHHFVTVRALDRGDRLVIHGAFDGKRYASRRLSERDSFFLPRGHRWICRAKGHANGTTLTCDLEHWAFAQALGDDAGEFDLEPYVGVNPIAPWLLERLEALCLEPDAFPRAYGAAVAVVLAYELFRVRSAKPFVPLPNARAGASRFKPVLARIDDSLGSEAPLSELASLMGLSISRFSHAFSDTYGVAPHRYILQRRIDKAKALLRTSDATVAAISARVGFASQSRFARVFARSTGVTPSTYRAGQRT
jgi:AraC family transcriptional regulator